MDTHLLLTSFRSYLNYQDDSEQPTEAIELKEPIIKRVCGYHAG
jgi:hypothetical protein